jgi:two-component system, OmpR family, sensor kinase
MTEAGLQTAPLATAEIRFDTLERLMAIRASDLSGSLTQAADLLARTFGAEKVDVFLHEPDSQTLVALGTSDTPLGRKQHRLGLHRLATANGGAAVRVFETGESHLTRRADEEGELRGLVAGLGIRSEMIAPVEIAGVRRGVVLASSRIPEYFGEEHLILLGTVARWVGLVAERAELMQRLADEAAARDRFAAAEELLAVVAHDVRNRLAPLRGRLDLLKRRALEAGHAGDARDATAAVVAVDRLGKLVDNLLDAERLQRGLFTLTPEAVDLVAVVREVTGDFATERVRIEMHAPEELWLSADLHRVRQILENIVANAVKHSPAAGRVLLDVSTETRSGVDGARVSIEDEGPGVPPELVSRLFERFARSGPSAGLGLGLFLAARIVEAHGGSLALESRVGSPARFTLWLPLVAP